VSAATENTAGAAAVDSAENAASENTAAPEIRVVHGNPTPEELAVVVAVLAAASVAAAQSRSNNDQRQDEYRGGWTARDRGVRTPLRPGPGGWRASGFPGTH